jgi:hypothetical protein
MDANVVKYGSSLRSIERGGFALGFVMHDSTHLRVEMMWVRHNPGAEELMLIMPAPPNIWTGSTRMREVIFPAYRIAWVNRMSLNPLTGYRTGIEYEATGGTLPEEQCGNRRSDHLIRRHWAGRLPYRH